MDMHGNRQIWLQRVLAYGMYAMTWYWYNVGIILYIMIEAYSWGTMSCGTSYTTDIALCR